MEQKFAYSYDPRSFIYKGKVQCYIDPLSNNFMLPANSTFLPLPEHHDGYIFVFNKKRRKWEEKINVIGEWFNVENGNSVIFDNYCDEFGNVYSYDLGILTDTNGKKYVRENPAHFMSENNLEFNMLEWDFYEKCWSITTDIEKIKNKLIEKLKEDRDKQLESDIEFNGVLFQSDTKSLAFMQNALNIFTDDAIAWVSSDNTKHLFSKEDFNKLILEICNRNNITMSYYFKMREELQKCETIEDVKNIIPFWRDVITRKGTTHE